MSVCTSKLVEVPTVLEAVSLQLQLCLDSPRASLDHAINYLKTMGFYPGCLVMSQETLRKFDVGYSDTPSLLTLAGVRVQLNRNLGLGQIILKSEGLSDAKIHV